MRLWLIGASLGLAAAPAAAQDSAIALLRAEQKTVPAPDRVERYGPDDLRRGELRLPRGRGPFPVAVVIHGGCWHKDYETLAGTAPLAEALRRRGIATWNIEYRRGGDPGGGWPGTFEDVAAGVDHLAVLARRHPLDLRRVALVGHSAGAHLALWAASRDRLGGAWAGRAGVKPVAVVPIDGPGAMSPFVGEDAKVCGRPVIRPFMGGLPADRPDAYRVADPSAHVPFGMRHYPVLGSLAPYMKAYIDAAQAWGDKVEVFAPPQPNHFDVVTPSTPNGRAVADWVAARIGGRK